MEPLLIKNSILINTLPQKVWDALINPNKTKIYMYGCETVSDWKVGSQLLWKGNYEGTEMVFVKGNIIEIEDFKKLVYTVFDPNSTMEDISQNYLTVTYELSAENEKTLLSVTQGDYNIVAEGDKRYKDSNNNGEGWNPILIQIKKLVETT